MPTSTPQLTQVEQRFTGLPNIGHGGYVAGLLASALGADSTAVRMRRPVPPDRPLVLEHTASDRIELRDGEVVLADARATEFEIDVPAPVTLAQARLAADHFAGHHSHPFPGCLVCGPERHEGDGLRIFPGRIPGRELIAAAWVPDGALSDDDGHVSSELVSAALDCPQLWALMEHVPADTPDRVVTAALETRLEGPVLVGEPHIVTAWPIGREGRNWLAGAAVFSADGDLRAVGRQTAVVVSGWGIPLGRDHWQVTRNDNHN